MDAKEIGRLLEARRVMLDLRQEDLAEMSGVTSRTIYQLENGAGNPSLQTLEKLFRILGLEIIVQVKKSV
jgi:transcriptional regulator with XRE-family HTH domain